MKINLTAKEILSIIDYTDLYILKLSNTEKYESTIYTDSNMISLHDDKNALLEPILNEWHNILHESKINESIEINFNNKNIFNYKINSINCPHGIVLVLRKFFSYEFMNVNQIKEFLLIEEEKCYLENSINNTETTSSSIKI